MKINWKDFAVTFVLWAVVYILARSVLKVFDFLNLTELISYSVLIAAISSISLIFYIMRNKKAKYSEVAAVAFLIPAIFLVGTFLLSSLNLFVQFAVFSIVVALMGLVWKFLIAKCK